MRTSARINEAVAAISSEELRVEAFVRTAARTDALPSLEPAELMEWLERREWIEQRQSEGDAGLAQVAAWRRDTLAEIVQDIRDSACDGAGLPRPDADWLRARLAVARLRALRRACGAGAGRA